MVVEGHAVPEPRVRTALDGEVEPRDGAADDGAPGADEPLEAREVGGAADLAEHGDHAVGPRAVRA